MFVSLFFIFVIICVYVCVYSMQSTSTWSISFVGVLCMVSVLIFICCVVGFLWRCLNSCLVSMLSWICFGFGLGYIMWCIVIISCAFVVFLHVLWLCIPACYDWLTQANNLSLWLFCVLFVFLCFSTWFTIVYVDCDYFVCVWLLCFLYLWLSLPVIAICMWSTHFYINLYDQSQSTRCWNERWKQAKRL
jgi:hypothetical protein